MAKRQIEKISEKTEKGAKAVIMRDSGAGYFVNVTNEKTGIFMYALGIFDTLKEAEAAQAETLNDQI